MTPPAVETRSWRIAGGAAELEAVAYSAAPSWDAGRAYRPTLVLAHGAGAGQRHRFMVDAAEALAARGLDVVTFDFPYVTAGRRVPDRAPVLERAWRDVVGHVVARGRTPIVIGGKSMGGRMATHVMAASDPPAAVCGIVLLGYPLNPPGGAGRSRAEHLARVAVPMLFVQGDRDAFGGPDELGALTAAIGSRAVLYVVPGADHGFRVTRAAVAAHGDVLGAAFDLVAGWVAGRTGARAGIL